jgi:hypothetical protein
VHRDSALSTVVLLLCLVHTSVALSTMMTDVGAANVNVQQWHDPYAEEGGSNASAPGPVKLPGPTVPPRPASFPSSLGLSPSAYLHPSMPFMASLPTPTPQPLTATPSTPVLKPLLTAEQHKQIDASRPTYVTELGGYVWGGKESRQRGTLSLLHYTVDNQPLSWRRSKNEGICMCPYPGARNKIAHPNLKLHHCFICLSCCWGLGLNFAFCIQADADVDKRLPSGPLAEAMNANNPVRVNKYELPLDRGCFFTVTIPFCLPCPSTSSNVFEVELTGRSVTAPRWYLAEAALLQAQEDALRAQEKAANDERQAHEKAVNDARQAQVDAEKELRWAAEAAQREGEFERNRKQRELDELAAAERHRIEEQERKASEERRRIEEQERQARLRQEKLKVCSQLGFRVAKLATMGAMRQGKTEADLAPKAIVQDIICQTLLQHPLVVYLAPIDSASPGQMADATKASTELGDALVAALTEFLDEPPPALVAEIQRVCSLMLAHRLERADKENQAKQALAKAEQLQRDKENQSKQALNRAEQLRRDMETARQQEEKRRRDDEAKRWAHDQEQRTSDKAKELALREKELEQHEKDRRLQEKRMEAEKQARRNAQAAANARRNNQMRGVLLEDVMKLAESR